MKTLHKKSARESQRTCPYEGGGKKGWLIPGKDGPPVGEKKSNRLRGAEGFKGPKKGPSEELGWKGARKKNAWY